MRDFLDILKQVYAICGALSIVAVLELAPIVLAVELNPWWAVVEVITAPLGLTVAVWLLCKTDEW